MTDLDEIALHAQQGDANAQTALGMVYANGTEGYPQDYDMAISWFNKAAEQKNAFAMFLLGQIYDNGARINKNIQEAVKQYKKSAKLGFAPSQFALAEIYAYGHGDDISQDTKYAFFWIKKAAKQGHPEAMFWLAAAYHDGICVEKDIQKCIKLLRRASLDSSHAHSALMNIGVNHQPMTEQLWPAEIKDNPRPKNSLMDIFLLGIYITIVSKVLFAIFA